MEIKRNINLETQSQQVVGSIVVSLASPNEIYSGLKRQTPAKFLRLYLGVKWNEEEGYRYTLLGGHINLDEDFNEAIQREVGEEANIVGLGIPWQTVIGRWQYSSEKSAGDREVILTYNPVLLNENTRSGNGVARIISLTLDQFEELINNGVLNDIPLETHLSTAAQPEDKIQISQEDIKKRDSALEKGISWMRHIENYLEKKFKSIIEKNPGLSQEEFVREYQRILSEFMIKGLIAGLKRSESIQEDQMDVSKRLKEAINSGFLGKDILYYLPYLVEYGLNWEGLNNATEGVRAFVDFFKKVFTDFLSENELSEEQYCQTLRTNEVPLQYKLRLIELLDTFFKHILKEQLCLTDDDLKTALFNVQNFFRDLSNELKVADPQLTLGLYQDFVLVNEVNNASYGYLLSLFLGYDTKENSQSAEKIIRFEAGRHLLLLFKALAGIQYYEKQLIRIREGRIELAINNFFGSIAEEKTVDLGYGVTMRIRKRKREVEKFIVDEKPTKTFPSFLRKSFEERIEDIKDFYGVSIVDENLNPEEFNLDYYNKIVNNFVGFLKEQYPDYEVNVSEIKTYGSKNFIEKKKKEVGGKRKGSQSERMVRGKVFIYLKDQQGNVVESVELTIYPFYSLKNNEGFWGWLEKIGDDKNYVARRLLAAQLGIPSLYDLLFPPSLYPHHYNHKLKAEYHN